MYTYEAMIKLRKNKRFLRQIIYSKITVILLGFILLFMLNGTWEVFKKANSARISKNSADVDLIELEARKEYLESSIDNLNTDLGIEQEVRSKFGVAKEGEEVVVIINGIDDEDSSSVQKKSLWTRIKDFFR